MTPRAFAALCFLALAGCVQSPDNDPANGDPCESYCTSYGMKVVGRFGYSRFNCICAADVPNCDAAWSRADAALDTLADCQAALTTCATRGGR